MQPIRVLIADDHSLVREALTLMLDESPDITVVGQAHDGQQAVEMACTLLPDVVLMDISMPRKTGLEATREILVRCPHVKVIGLSMHEAETIAETMQRAGAVSFITKSAPAAELFAAIRSAA